jgi:hypothetical protein
VADASNPQTLIPVPVIIVVEHDWKLLFACDRGNRIVSVLLRCGSVPSLKSRLLTLVPGYHWRYCDRRHEKHRWSFYHCCSSSQTCKLDPE